MEMSWEEKREKLREFFESVETPELKGNLSEACYSYSEMLTDYLQMDTEDAILVWKMVESVRTQDFPDELVM